MKKEDYPKVFLSIDDQIKQLIGRGLIIDNTDYAKHHLKNISYFRLQGFWWELQSNKVKHKFREGTTFEFIVSLYTFDRKLRIILIDALERIEIALRTKMVYYMSNELKDWWWFEDFKNFFVEEFYDEAIKDIDKDLFRSKELFIEKHYENYGDENRPPAYKTFEILSFGTLSKIYSNLSNELECKKRIAVEFDLPNYNFLKSWMQSFNTIRNISAHHSRLWNRNVPIAPKLLSKPISDFVKLPEDHLQLYYSISCIIYILNKVSAGHSIKGKLLTLFDSNEERLSEMGFPDDWKQEPLWTT